MIEKVLSIKNVGRFRDYSARKDVAFRKLTLIFAENGQGKTTLCAILRSLKTGNPEFILERKTLGSGNPPSVQIRLTGDTASYSNGAWENPQPNIAIFDSAFVHANVYAGDFVLHDHKKNLYRVIIGSKGVQLAKQIEELDGLIRETNKNISAKKDVLSRTLPSGVTLDSYLAWQPIGDVENRIRTKSVALSTQQRALEKAADIQSKGLLSRVSLPSLPGTFLGTLAKELVDIVADAEARVRKQVSDHGMGHQGEAWLSDGLAYIASEKCPFCGQNLKANDLIAAYRSHFSTAYNAVKQEVASLGQQITDSIGESAIHYAMQGISANQALVEFWKQFVEMNLPDVSLALLQAQYGTLLDSATELARRKQHSPTESVLPTKAFSLAVECVEKLQHSMQQYNAAVDVCNDHIKTQKASTQGGGAIAALQAELADLQARGKRFKPEVVQACDAYQAALAEKNALDRDKDKVKKQLDEYCENVLKTFEESINAYLDQFNTGFRIANSRHMYTGGTPSSHYQIVISGTAIDLGDPKTEPGAPCFKAALSSGDRSALALAFFLAALKQDPEMANKIVVLDDPFTSQDRFRQTCTYQLIGKIAGACKQTIVLSHDAHFLRLVWDDNPHPEVKVLQLYPSGKGTAIGECDIEAETQSTYHKNYSTLLSYYRDRTGIPLDVAKAIRPFLEGMLRAHFPGRFNENEWLGDFLVRIRDADATDGLQHAQADIAELEAIKNYSKRFHHEKGDDELPSPDELHGFVKRTLRLVGGC